MARSTLSVLGLYNWDATLFDALQLPAGVDREVLVNNLLMQCAEFEVLYPDPEFFRRALQTWSSKELPVWQKLYDTTLLKYEPLENYDRQEEWSDTGNNTSNGTTSSTSNNTGKSSSTGKVAAYNSDTMEPRDMSETSDTNNATSTGSSEIASDSRSTHKGRIHGNIGVTTSQQMLDEERRVSLFNLMDIIIDSFQRRFCLLIY